MQGLFQPLRNGDMSDVNSRQGRASLQCCASGRLWTFRAISTANGIRQAVTPGKSALGCSPQSKPAARISGGPGHPRGPHKFLCCSREYVRPKEGR